jgi:HSP20 family protein
LEDWFWQISGDIVVVGTPVGLGTLGPARRYWEPKADLIEDPRHFILTFELAGINTADVQIAYLPDRHSVLVRGVRYDEELPGTQTSAVHQLEIYYGEFERELRLPDTPINPEGMKAHYRAGLLYVLVPKAKQRIRYAHTTVFKA